MSSDDNNFHQQLRQEIDKYVHLVYGVTKNFPREEIYGVVSQLRRAALSVMLNYIEGYARGNKKGKMLKNFLEISYGSLQESRYLIDFSYKEGYLSGTLNIELEKLSNHIGAMLWGILRRL